MEIESAKCECCGLREDCTEAYIGGIKAEFEGRWLCGLCAEAVRDTERRQGQGVEEAMRSHLSFSRKLRSNPAVRVAEGMRQMLRRRSGDSSTPRGPTKKSGRLAVGSKVEDESSVRIV